jgi:hypothetical protein
MSVSQVLFEQDDQRIILAELMSSLEFIFEYLQTRFLMPEGKRNWREYISALKNFRGWFASSKHL